MEAVISGQAGVALLLDGEALFSMHKSRPGALVRRRSGDSRWLLGEAKDLEFLEGVSPDQVSHHLEQASARADALHLALILLDGSLAHDTRRSAAEELEELLGDPGMAADWVERVLYSHPLPRSADPAGARAACTGRTRHVRAFLGRLESHQGGISEVHHAWERIPLPVFGTGEERSRALSVAVREGFFRDLVTARAAGKPAEGLLARAQTARMARDARQVLRAWVAELRKPGNPRPDDVRLDAFYVAEDRIEEREDD